MRESMWAFPVALSVHLLGLVLLVGMRLAIDLRLTGWAFGGVPASQLVRRAAPWSLVGAIVTVVSGMALYAADAARMAANPVFQLKVAALALALVNAWFFHAVLGRRMRDWDTRSAAAPRCRRRPGFRSRCGRRFSSPASSFVHLVRLTPGGLRRRARSSVTAEPCS